MLPMLLVTLGCGVATGRDFLASTHQLAKQKLAEQTTMVGEAPTRSDKVVHPDKEWRKRLDEAEFHILREAGTERAFTGRYWDNKQDGTYHCAGCDLELFDSTTKFRSGSGWPSFHSAVGSDHVFAKEDHTLGMKRTEVLCNRCGGHLGHVFDDGPEPTNLRYCINGYALDFIPREAPKQTQAPVSSP